MPEQDKARLIAPGVHWIGAFDPDLRSFDIIMRTANGTTYNAYAVRGNAGVAVIDTVKLEFAEDFFRRLESIARYDEIRVIVLNHMEPDHSGALPELLRRAPQAQIYVSVQGRNMLKGFLPSELFSDRLNLVYTDDTVSLGDRTLKFINTPYLHWPDTQCTWLEEEGLLFSGDFLGCHYCDERLFNDLTGDFLFSFDYYYGHIMRPFRQYVQKALDQLEDLPLVTVAPAHGPVLRHNPQQFLQRYRQLASPAQAVAIPTLLVFYITAYGATQRMAQAIVEGAESIGEEIRVSMYDIEGGELAPFVNLIENADGIIIGSPTINADAVKPVWDLLSSLAVIELRGKLGAAFGSYGWSGEAVAMIEERLRRLKMRVPLTGLRARLVPTEEELQQCRELGQQAALTLLGKNEPRTVDMASLA